MTRILVTGAGGFIGHHLVTRLKALGHWVRGIDLKPPEYAPTEADEFERLDLRRWENCVRATRDIDEVYALAADMGGIGFISSNHGAILFNNTLISTQTLEAARRSGVQRYLLASSACVYPRYRQLEVDSPALREQDAYPAEPEDGYGFEKLAAERLCLYYGQEYGIGTRIARLHNVYGPFGAWDGGREKAPAAICRKVAIAKLTGKHEVEIWGDGEQTRSFCYVDDCVHGLQLLMRSDHREPLNLGHDRRVTINQLVDIVAAAAGIKVVHRLVPGTQGVRGRNSDNTRLRAVLEWTPATSLEDGIARTYAWVEEQVERAAWRQERAPERRLRSDER